MTPLFGTSGIREKFSETTPSLALKIGKTLGYKLGKGSTVVIGKDTRTTGDTLETSLISGLLSQGVNVTRIGVVTTPTLGLATRHLGADTGVMITASHNPPEYNGIKLWNNNGCAYTPNQGKELEELYREIDQIGTASWHQVGRVGDYQNAVSDHIALLRSHSNPGPHVKRVVVDTACGPAAMVTPTLLRSVGAEVITINSQMDGFFPGRPPEPTPENLGQLSSTVKAVNADIGIAHDGDGDRIAAVDEKGRFIPFDSLLALIAGYIAKKTMGKIITTVDASMAVIEHVTRNGGKIVRTKVGDVHLAQKILEEKAVFGGEPSGTWIHPDVHLTPDGPLSALRIYEILSKTDRPISTLVDTIPKYHTIRSRIKCPNNLKPEVISRVYKELSPDYDQVETIDGVLLANKEEWTLIRPSGTEECVRITTEAKNKEQLLKKHKEIELIVKKIINEIYWGNP